MNKKTHTYRPEEIRQKLSEAGLKATLQRIAIYDALCRLGDHPKAENVYEVVREQHPSLSLGTVYKTLDSFVSAKLIRKVHTQEDCMRYDVDVSNHSHIYCTNTGEIMDFHDEELDALLQEFFKRKKISNLSIQGFRLLIDGKKEKPDQSVDIR